MFSQLLRDHGHSLTFTVLDVGALPLSGEPERCHRLLAAYPGSRVFAFEIDPALCERLNGRALPGLRYLPYALGAADEERAFFETQHPMCSSLYRPNEPLLDRYLNLEVARLQRETTIRTHRLDRVARQADVGQVDFIKVDVQGAELDVLRGGEALLGSVLAVVSEVEFLPIYQDQPLFGDVCAWLSGRGLIFHKFLGLSGRSMRPVLVKNDPNHPIQHLWSDAVFLRDLGRLAELAPQQLLKLAVLADLYGSPDVACFALMEFERRGLGALVDAYLAALGRGAA